MAHTLPLRQRNSHKIFAAKEKKILIRFVDSELRELQESNPITSLSTKITNLEYKMF